MRCYKILGDFFDCQLYKGHLYVWTMEGALNIYNWYKILNLFENQESVDLSNIVSEQKSITLAGGLFPTDTAIVGNSLYTALETGLYRNYIVKGYIEEATKISDIVPITLCTYNKNKLGICAGEDGLFEMRCLPKSLKPNQSDYGIHRISHRNITHCYYNKNLLFSMDNNQKQFVYQFNEDVNLLKPTFEELTFEEFIGNKETYKQLGNSEVYNIYDGQIYLYKLGNTRNKITSKRLNISDNTIYEVKHINKGYIIESNAGLQFINLKKEILRIESPITQFRYFHRAQEKSDYLFVILDDEIRIYKV